MSAGAVNGTAIVFGAETVIGGQFREVIAAGAVTADATRDLPLLRDHDSARVVARTSSGTLQIKIDRRGLHYSADVADTGDGRDLVELVRRGDVKGNSFAFSVARGGDAWYSDKDPSGLPLRVVEKIGRLYEVSAVTMPAYPQTTLSEGAAMRAGDVDVHDRRRLLYGLPLSPAFDARAMNRPGVRPILRPPAVSLPTLRYDGALREFRSALHGDMPVEVACALLEPDITGEELAALYAEGPMMRGTARYAIAAYRSLAESRGVGLDVVINAAREGRLVEILQLPERAR